MLYLIGKAISGVMLTREARDAVREAGGLASAIQSSADARLIKAALVAQGMQVASAQTGATPVGGSTALSSPRTWTGPNSIPMAVRMAVASKPAATPAAVPMQAPAPTYAPAATPIATPIPDANDRIVPSDFTSAKGRDFMTPERANLIKNAMKLHSEKKQTVLAHLTDEQRAMLTAIATKALLPQAAE